MRRVVELIVRVSKGSGGVSQVLGAIAAKRTRVLAHCSYADCFGTTVLLAAEDETLARLALTASGWRYKTEPVVLVQASRQPGVVAQLGFSLAGAGIWIIYSYASAGEGAETFAVFKTTDDEQAVRVLRDGWSVLSGKAAGPVEA